MPVRNILNYPVWFLELFTRAKSFRNNPIIGSRFLNRIGLHVFRLTVSRCIFLFRRAILVSLASREDREEFSRNGFIVKENFLPEDEFRALLEEALHYEGDAWESIQGDTITRHVLLDYENLRTLTKCSRFVKYHRLLNLLKWCAGKSSYPRFFIQRIMNNHAAGEDDPQKKLHSDTFHPAVKCWFFLKDVGRDDGPFTYVPGSHRMNWRRLKWEYRKSCIASTLDDGHSEDGSFRASREELKQLGLGHPVPLPVNKNTLVIADTSGFHCRGQSGNKNVRLEIFGFFRPNPFNPFPGIDLPVLRLINQWVIKNYYYYRDRKARDSGKTAFWHLVSARSDMN